MNSGDFGKQKTDSFEESVCVSGNGLEPSAFAMSTQRSNQLS